MANEPRSSDTDKQTSGVTFGNVFGGIWNSIIAGGDVIVQTFTGSDERRAQRNRRAMLELVKNTWVKGVLEQSLHGAAMIELGLEERADAVERSWDTILQTPDQPIRPLPCGTRIISVFNALNRALLILGTPGSGKTTMLLDLTRDAIARAESDPTQPIPVVFNLSSWAEKRQSIAEWLVDELNTKYNIPKRIARPWVENDDLLLLLDGLDEVKREYREACVKAINDFREEHGLTPLVVCSRIADYDVLTTRLKLRGAVILQPLTPEQIDQYLEGTGTELLAMRKTLQHDPALQELARSPLMLSVMTLAYRGVSIEDLGSLASVEARREHLFEAYVQRMIERRGRNEPYSPKQVNRQLTWLARNMTKHAQTVFLIERLQPSWLLTHWQCLLYTLASRLIGGLSAGIISGIVLGPLFAAEFGGKDAGLTYGLLFGPIAGLAGGLAIGFIDVFRFTGKNEAKKRSPFARLWRSVIRFLGVSISVGLSLMLAFGLIFGVFFGAIFGDVSTLLSGVFAGLVAGWNGALCLGPVFGLLFGLRVVGRGLRDDILTVENLRLSPRQGFKGCALGLVSALALGLVLGLLFGLRDNELLAGSGLLGRLFAGLLFGVVLLGPICALVGSLLGSVGNRLIEKKSLPNQGIRLSLRNAVVTGAVFSPIAGLVIGLVSGVTSGDISVGLGSGLSVGLSLGLLAALWYGGLDVIQHFTLRLVLYLGGTIPWNLACFLDYAAEHIFLRKVGGGYMFIHRLLMEYFVNLGPQQAQAEETTQATPNLYRKWILRAVLFIGVALAAVTAYNANIPHRILATTYTFRADSKSSDPEQALRYYTRATELDPDNAGSWHGVCWYGSLSGNAADVMYACERAVELDPDNAGIRYCRGRARMLTWDYNGAIEDFKRVTELDPDNAQGWNSVCWYGSLLGHAADVMYACEGAVELAPDDGGIRDSRGLARALTGDYAGAIEDFEFFVEWSKKPDSNASNVAWREAWIADLKAGRNPFDETTLEQLRNE